MAIKFSAHGCFRSSIKNLVLKDPYSGVSEEKKQTLVEILGKMEEHVVHEKFGGLRDRASGPGFDLTVTTEFTETVVDKPATAQLFIEVHEALKHHSIPKEIYRYMGDALVEQGINISEVDEQISRDIEYVIRAARFIGKEWPYNSLELIPAGRLSRRDAESRRRDIER